MKIKNFAIVVTALFLEFLRDYCFINLNLYIDYLENIKNGLNVFNYTDSLLMILFKGIKNSNLYFLKWVLSLFFAFNFIGLGLLFSKVNFRPKHHNKFLNYFLSSGLIILLISFIIYHTGNFLKIENRVNFYNVSLELSHFIQSSLFLIIYILMFWAVNNKKF